MKDLTFSAPEHTIFEMLLTDGIASLIAFRGKDLRANSCRAIDSFHSFISLAAFFRLNRNVVDLIDFQSKSKRFENGSLECNLFFCFFYWPVMFLYWIK